MQEPILPGIKPQQQLPETGVEKSQIASDSQLLRRFFAQTPESLNEGPRTTYPNPLVEEEKRSPQQEMDAVRKFFFVGGGVVAVVTLLLIGFFYDSSRSTIQNTAVEEEAMPRGGQFIAANLGGEILNDGARLIIPPDALDRDETIVLKRVGDGVVTDRYFLAPEGIKFKKPVMIILPYKNDAAAAQMEMEYWKDAQPRIGVPFILDRKNKTLKLELTEF